MDTLPSLCELFPDVAVEKILDVMQKNQSAPLERLVEILLQEQEDAGAASGSPGGTGEKVAGPVEMVSLLPPFVEMETQQRDAGEGKEGTTEIGQRPAAPITLPAEGETKEKYPAFERALAALRLDLPPVDLQGTLVTLRALARCAANVLEHPDSAKYRQLSLSNPRFKEKVASMPGALAVLEAMGFRRIDVDGSSLFVLPNEDLDASLLAHARQCLEEQLIQLESRARTPLESDPLYTSRLKRSRADSASGPSAPAPAAPAKSRRISREEMASIVARRLAGAAPTEGTVRQGRVADFAHLAKLNEQIAAARHVQHRKWITTRQGRKRVYTLDDLEAMQREEVRLKGQFGTGTSPDLNAIGKEALRLTNEFRAKHGLPPLQWHQALADIGYEHSRNMGEGKVPFDHVGFNERVKRYPFPSRSAAENLAMNQGCADVARTAVEGWIDSPGHRRNLLSKHNLCGIGVYRNAAGAYYLTQLFGLY